MEPVLEGGESGLALLDAHHGGPRVELEAAPAEDELREALELADDADLGRGSREKVQASWWTDGAHGWGNGEREWRGMEARLLRGRLLPLLGAANEQLDSRQSQNDGGCIGWGVESDGGRSEKEQAAVGGGRA